MFRSLTLLALTVLSCFPLAAQERTPVETPPVTGEKAAAPAVSSPVLSSGDKPVLDIETLAGRLEAIENDATLDDVARQEWSKRYREAIESLEKAAELRERTSEFRAAMEAGPAEAERLRTERDALLARGESAREPDVPGEGTSHAEIEAAIARETVELGRLRGEAAQWTELTGGREARPQAIRERLEAAAEELKSVEAELELLSPGEENAGALAERARLVGARERLVAEIAMLEEEEVTMEIRLSAAEAALELVQLKIENGEARIAALRSLATELLSDQVRAASTLVGRIRLEMPAASEQTLKPLLDSVVGLVEETRELTASVEASEEALEAREKERRRITESFAEVNQQLEMGGIEGVIAQVMIEKLRMIPSRWEG